MNKSAIAYYKQMTILMSTLGLVVLVFFVIAQNMEIQHYNELYEDLCKGLIAFQTTWNGTSLGQRYIPTTGKAGKGTFGYGGGIGGGFGLGAYCSSEKPQPSPTSPSPSKCIP